MGFLPILLGAWVVGPYPNDPLHTTFGSRWAISIETQRIKCGGRTSEECDVRIIDTEPGLDGLVEDLSDGERTIIGADRVFLISHSEDAQELCDARNEVEDRTARIVGDALEYRSEA